MFVEAAIEVHQSHLDIDSEMKQFPMFDIPKSSEVNETMLTSSLAFN